MHIIILIIIMTICVFLFVDKFVSNNMILFDDNQPFENYVAVFVTTNLVSVPCMGGNENGVCQWCNSEIGMRIPEHMNRIGYDLKVVVSTNYLPIVKR